MPFDIRRGVFFSILASSLFGLMVYATTWLAPLSGLEIYGWRMALSLPLVTLLMGWDDRWASIAQVWQRIVATPQLLWGIAVCSALLTMQLALFMWAPVNHLSLEVSLGYFILPLSLILTGRWVYQEKLSTWQSAAALLGLLGVCNQVFNAGGVSWPTAVINVGYPLYFVLRRKLHLNHLGGLWFEIALAYPLALYLVFQSLAHHNGLWQQHPSLAWGLLGLGLISTTALMSHVLSARFLPLGLFGLLGYVEPVLLVAVAWVLGDPIEGAAWWTFIPIWIAVLLLALEGLLGLRRSSDH